MIVSKEVRSKIKEVKDRKEIAFPPYIDIPRIKYIDSCDEKIKAVQGYIESFKYNYHGKPFLPIKKSKSNSYIHKTANELIKLALPIQVKKYTQIICTYFYII